MSPRMHRVRPLARDRIDWSEFFVQFACPHGVRIRLQDVPAGASEEARLEKRLARFIKARVAVEGPYALRRSTVSGPAMVDCVFATAAVADEFAQAIGATTMGPPLRWATGRELVTDERAIRHLWQTSREKAPPGRRPAGDVGRAESPAPRPASAPNA